MADPIKLVDLSEITAGATTGEEIFYMEYPNGSYHKIKNSSIQRTTWPISGTYSIFMEGGYRDPQTSVVTPPSVVDMQNPETQRIMGYFHFIVPAGKRAYLDKFSGVVSYNGSNPRWRVVGENTYQFPSVTNSYLPNTVLRDNSAGTTSATLYLTVNVQAGADASASNPSRVYIAGFSGTVVIR